MRVALDVRFPEDTDDSVWNRIEDFLDAVWQHLLHEGYGSLPYLDLADLRFCHWATGCGYSYMEDVPLDRWESLLTRIVSGLRHFCLENQTKVILLAPSGGDWHRDIERIVWPTQQPVTGSAVNPPSP
jgi:hypothetical protein